MFAFLPTLGFQEMVLLLVLGIVLFGRNLPDVGRTLGRTVAQLRRGMQEFKDQMGRDESIRELRDSVKQTRDQIARVGTVPRALANPSGALRDLARDTLTSTDDATSTGDARPAGSPANNPDDDIADDTANGSDEEVGSDRADGEHEDKRLPATDPPRPSGDPAS